MVEESSLEAKVEEGSNKSLARHIAEAGAVFGAIGALHAIPSKFIENYYTNGVYRGWAKVASTVSDSVPFSLSECVVLAGGVLIGYKALPWLYNSAKKFPSLFRKLRLPSLEDIANSASAGFSVAKCVGLALLFGYYLPGALNSRRPPIIDNISCERPSSDDLHLLDGEISKLRPGIVRFSDLARINDVLNTAVDRAYTKLYGVDIPTARRVKITSLLPLAAAGAKGITIPQFQECMIQLDGRQDYELVFAMAHEKGHLKGFIDESEASLFAFKACMESGDALLQKSALCYLYDLGVISRFNADASQTVLDRVLRAKGQGSVKQAYVVDTFSKVWTWYSNHYKK